MRHLNLNDSIYNSDILQELNQLEQFDKIAWSGHIRSLYYSESRKMLIQYIEGDLKAYSQVTEEDVAEKLQNYPKAEVARESLDPRFDR